MCCVSLYVCVWNTYQGHSGTKVPKFDIYRSIISLSEIPHQMWHNHPFRQRNKTSKIEVEMKVGGNRKDGLGKILKRWGRQYRVSS